MTSPTAVRSTAADTTADKFPWLPILVLGFAGFLGLTVELSPAGLLNSIAADLDVSLASVGTLTTFFALGNALLVLPLTAFVMRFSRRTALVSMMTVFVISNVIVAVAPAIFAADIGRFLGGAAFAVQCALIPAVAVHIAGPRYAGRAMSIVLAANALGMALGAPIASLVGVAVGWRVTFIAAAGIALLVGALLALTVPQIRSAADGRMSLLEATRLPGVVRVCIFWALLMLGHFVVLTYIDGYFKQLGIPGFVTSLSLFLLGAGGILGVILIGRISQRSAPAALVVAPSAVVVALGVLATRTNSLLLVLVAMAIWGIGFSGTILVAQQTILLLGRRAPETSMSIGILLAQVGFALGATIGGLVVIYWGITTIPIVAVVFVLGAVAVAISLRRRVNQSTQEQTNERNLADNAVATETAVAVSA
ncbi:MFS transporter [Arthrobacter sp. 35W]|uniref:MFS transporter n=1 Tax=Arthrobacter sp. 35W TaxID=1132441 RepID=UPI00047EDB23|nr:MFS transporter [Arthrobacter sp. 35W]